jgi:hypothetical protein
MSDILPPHPGQLVTWLKANVLMGIGLSITIIASASTIVWTTSRWIATFENQIELNKGAVTRASESIVTLQGNIVSLDHRVNDLSGRVIELHTLSDSADAALKNRLDVIDALSKYAADRAMQPNLPIPKGSK